MGPAITERVFWIGGGNRMDEDIHWSKQEQKRLGSVETNWVRKQWTRWGYYKLGQVEEEEMRTFKLGQ